MVTLTGTGGCGKTRLAVEIAYQELPSRADGCYFVDLSAVSGGSELPAAVASAEVVILAVGTPSTPDGTVDMRATEAAARQLARSLTGYTVIVTKSTVPGGTHRRLSEIGRAHV